MFPIKTILHPTDFSKCSAHAFPFACALARDYGARLIVVHVHRLEVVYSEMMAAVPVEKAMKALLDYECRWAVNRN